MSQTPNILHFSPLVLLNFTLLIIVSSYSDQISTYTDFIYKKCRNDTRIPQRLVSSLLQELAEKSIESKFYQTSTGDDKFAISGKFQCRHDLTVNNCHDCVVNTVRQFTCSIGGGLGRVQLKGCFLTLEPEPDPELHDNESIKVNNGLVGVWKDFLQHKKCGERRPWFEGFGEVRDAAFESVAKCVASSGVGYCDTRRGGVYAMAQCDGSLEECVCGECVSNAFQVAQDECWGSDSGEVYLENCFVSFSDDYQPHEAGGNSSQENGVGGSSTKVVAMVVGIAVALGLLSTLGYCIKSSRKKQES